MKWKRIYALSLAVLMTCTAFQMPARAEDAGNEKTSVQEINDFVSPEERLSKMEKITGSSGVELYLDTTNVDIAVRDTNSGGIWFSSPYDTGSDAVASETIKNRMSSQIRVQMLNAQNEEIELLSYIDCILKNQYSWTSIDDGVRIEMTLGTEEQRRLLPDAIPADSMEEYILDSLEGRELSKVEYFYKKYDVDEMSKGQAKEMTEKYPLLQEEPIYILKSVSEREKNELEGYLKKTDYTFELMEQDIERLGIETAETAKPYVKLAVEYTIDKDGAFYATIDCASVEYDNTNFVLSEIYLLEYFTAADYRDNTGYILLPDGSGSIMEFNSAKQKSSTELTLETYGYDMALSYDVGAITRSQVILPVYAISSAKGSVLCSVNRGAARTTLYASSGGTNSEKAYAGYALSFSDVDKFSFIEISTQQTWVISDAKAYSGQYELCYQFLEPNSSYSQLAKAYREKLVDDGALKKKTDTDEALLVLGTLGTVEYLDKILCFPVNRLIPLTDTDDIKTIADDLIDAGVNKLDFRYIGWANNGLNNAITSNAKIEGALGTQKSLKETIAYLNKQGISMYLDSELQLVTENSSLDSFRPTSDAVRLLNRQYANYYSMNLATNAQDDETQVYLLNKTKLSKVFQKYQKGYKKLGTDAMSLSSLGNLLYSDKNIKTPYGIEKAETAVKKILKEASDKYSLMVTGGNAYTFAYADEIVELQGSDSGLMQTDYSVPFVQMVLHGYVSYTSASINHCGDSELEVLKAAENGAQLYYEVAYQNADKLKDTEYSNFYAADYDKWSNDIKNTYQKMEKVFEGLQTETLEEHQYLTDAVVLTTYSNGVQIIVNYAYTDFEYNGQIIPARDFARVEG